MTGSKLVSRGTAYFAVISTLNLLIIMAAIANDGTVNNSLTSLKPKTTPKSPPPLPIHLIRGPRSYEAVVKVGIGTNVASTTPSTSIKMAPFDNTTISSLTDVINSSSTSPFITQNWTEVRAQYKSNALLPCHIKNSGDGVTVSWIRRKDYHLLTVGLQTYSSDDRFQAIHSQSPDDWTLKIKYVQPRDAGVYECQVSTHPPSSIFVNLNVVEVTAQIVGGPEKIYKAGSTVELKCDLIDSTEEPEYVFWYQGLQMINYDRSRHINVTHYKSSSVLVLHNVQKSDTGNYSCVPSNAHPASIFVHIINGENPAAMQHGSHSTSCVPCPPLWFLSFLLSLILQALYFRFMSHHVDRYHQGALTANRSDCQHPKAARVGLNGGYPSIVTEHCQCHHYNHKPSLHNHESHLSISTRYDMESNSSNSRRRFLDCDQKENHSQELSNLAKHYCCCKESEKDSSIVSAFSSTLNRAETVGRNEKSGTRSSLPLDCDSALYLRSEWRQEEQFLPITNHSEQLTFR